MNDEQMDTMRALYEKVADPYGLTFEEWLGTLQIHPYTHPFHEEGDGQMYRFNMFVRLESWRPPFHLRDGWYIVGEDGDYCEADAPNEEV